MQLKEAYCILHDHVFSVVKSSRNLSVGTTSQEISASTTSQ